MTLTATLASGSTTVTLTAPSTLPSGRLFKRWEIDGHDQTKGVTTVSVTMDTVAQIQSHLLAHQYEGLIKKSKLRGRGR